MSKKEQKGFTLVELLIVVLIIGVLGAILVRFFNIRGIRAKARDAQRKEDLRYIQSALELYYSDNRMYPPATVDLLNGYLNTLPRDPRSGGDYFYDSVVRFEPAGSGYVLVSGMEIPPSVWDSECDDDFAYDMYINDILPDSSPCYVIVNTTSHIVPQDPYD